MKSQIISLLCLFIVLSLFNSCHSAKYRTHQQLSKLQEGVLLVRLTTAENAIAKYEQLGMEKKARAVAFQKRAENDALIHAFQEEFDFCPVYFFYSSDTKKIKQQQLQTVAFFDVHKKVVAPTSIPKNKFLIAEVGRAYDTELLHNKNGQAQAVAGVGGIPALVVMDANFIQLKKPFPYVSGTFDRSKTSMVKKFNTVLSLKASELNRWWNIKKAKGKDKDIEQQSMTTLN